MRITFILYANLSDVPNSIVDFKKSRRNLCNEGNREKNSYVDNLF